MIGCFRAACATFITLLLVVTGLFAQPELPKLACSCEKGSVSLTWKCQYDNVKSITVFRSQQKDFNYATVGYVKQVKKGIQGFTDNKPYIGDNYYKLLVIFKSGLNWHSDYCHTFIDSAMGNNNHIDTVTNPQNVPHPDTFAIQAIPKRTTKNFSNAGFDSSMQTKSFTPQQQRDFDAARARVDSMLTKIAITMNEDSSKKYTTVAPKQHPVYDSAMARTSSVKLADHDTTVKIKILKKQPEIATPKKHFSLPSAHDTDADQVCYIVSKYIYTDSVTGHVKIVLDDEVKEHHYLVKFYDMQHNIALEVPRINAPVIILDKRNFQKRGNYKFVLKKDGAEIESGFITIY